MHAPYQVKFFLHLHICFIAAICDHMASLRWLAEMSTVQRQEAEALILLDLNSSQ